MVSSGDLGCPIPPHPCLFSPCAARKLQGLSPAPTHRLGFLQAELHRYISGLSCDCHSQNKSELPERRRDIVTPGCRPLGQKVPHVCLVSEPGTAPKPESLSMGQKLGDLAAATANACSLSLSSPSCQGGWLQGQGQRICLWPPHKGAPCPFPHVEDWQVEGDCGCPASEQFSDM